MKILPPFMYQTFYFRGLPMWQALDRVVLACLEKGAELKLSASLIPTGQDPDQPYLWDNHDPWLSEEFPAPDYMSLPEAFRRRMRWLNVRDAIATKPGALEHIAFAKMSPEAVRQNRHPVYIETDGWVFDAFEPGSPDWLLAAERQYRAFKLLTTSAKPDFATIRAAMYTACPADMHIAGLGLHAEMIYLSRDFILQPELDRLAGMVRLNEVEQTRSGVYFNFSPGFVGDADKLWHYDDDATEKARLDEADQIQAEMTRLLVEAALENDIT